MLDCFGTFEKTHHMILSLLFHYCRISNYYFLCGLKKFIYLKAGGHIQTTQVSSDPFFPTHTVLERNGKSDGAEDGVIVECSKPKQRKGKIIVRASSAGWNSKYINIIVNKLLKGKIIVRASSAGWNSKYINIIVNKLLKGKIIVRASSAGWNSKLRM